MASKTGGMIRSVKKVIIVYDTDETEEFDFDSTGHCAWFRISTNWLKNRDVKKIKAWDEYEIWWKDGERTGLERDSQVQEMPPS